MCVSSNLIKKPQAKNKPSWLINIHKTFFLNIKYQDLKFKISRNWTVYLLLSVLTFFIHFQWQIFCVRFILVFSITSFNWILFEFSRLFPLICFNIFKKKKKTILHSLFTVFKNLFLDDFSFEILLHRIIFLRRKNYEHADSDIRYMTLITIHFTCFLFHWLMYYY